jgi:hypothetical protein
VITEHMTNFIEDPEIISHGLSIMIACLKELSEDTVAFKLVNSGVPQLLNKLLLSPNVGSAEVIQALHLLVSLSKFHSVHRVLIREHLLSTVADKLRQFTERSHADSTTDDFSILVLHFQFLTDFCGNPDIKGDLVSNRVLERMHSVFTKYGELDFLSQLFVLSLKSIASSFDGVQFLRSSNLDLKGVCVFALKSRNALLMSATSFVIDSLLDEGQVRSLVEGVKQDSNWADSLIKLGLLSANNKAVAALGDKALLTRILGLYGNEQLQGFEKSAAVGALTALVSANVATAHQFEAMNGFDVVLKGADSRDGLFAWFQIANLWTAVLEQSNPVSADSQKRSQQSAAVLRVFEGLTETLETCVRAAITTEKAAHSINYHQGEVARFVLKTLSGVREEDVIDSTLALNFLVSKAFSQTGDEDADPAEDSAQRQQSAADPPAVGQRPDDDEAVQEL